MTIMKIGFVVAISKVSIYSFWSSWVLVLRLFRDLDLLGFWDQEIFHQLDKDGSADRKTILHNVELGVMVGVLCWQRSRRRPQEEKAARNGLQVVRKVFGRHRQRRWSHQRPRDLYCRLPKLLRLFLTEIRRNMDEPSSCSNREKERRRTC